MTYDEWLATFRARQAELMRMLRALHGRDKPIEVDLSPNSRATEQIRDACLLVEANVIRARDSQPAQSSKLARIAAILAEGPE